MKTAQEYIESLRQLKTRVYMFGEKIDNWVDHPMIRPSINCVAMTYAVAEDPQYAELMNGALEMARSFTKNAPIAVKYSKACIDRGMQMDIDDAIALENELFGMCYATADQKEGMTAFLEKRPAKFENK